MTEDFETWYQRTHPRLVVALVASFGDLDVSADASAEAFVRAYERWADVSTMDSPDGWVFRVGFNVAKRRARRRSLERRLLPSGHSTVVEGPAGEIWLVVSMLPKRQRHAVVLRHVGQFTEAEIADMMNITRGTVSATLRAAYRSLRTRLTTGLVEELL